MKRALRMLFVMAAWVSVLAAFFGYFFGDIGIPMLFSVVVVAAIIIWPWEILGALFPSFLRTELGSKFRPRKDTRDK